LAPTCRAARSAKVKNEKISDPDFGRGLGVCFRLQP
jgi:hypothetical protein